MELADLLREALVRGGEQGGILRSLQVLTQQGISSGHFDPMYWLIDAWFGMGVSCQPPVGRNLPKVALAHFQHRPIRMTEARAAYWIALNILRQNEAMEREHWPYTRTRQFDLRQNQVHKDKVIHVNEYWRSTGVSGGIWCYPRHALRDEGSSFGDWLVIAAIPQPFLYPFIARNVLGTHILPGPIPPKCIVKQGPTKWLFDEMRREQGDVNAYLRKLENT